MQNYFLPLSRQEKSDSQRWVNEMMKILLLLLLVSLSSGCLSKQPTRVYQSQDAVEALMRFQKTGYHFAELHDGADLTTWTKSLLGKLGVDWEDGSSFSIDTNSFIIVISNSEQQLDNFERIITMSGVDSWPDIKRLK